MVHSLEMAWPHVRPWLFSPFTRGFQKINMNKQFWGFWNRQLYIYSPVSDECWAIVPSYDTIRSSTGNLFLEQEVASGNPTWQFELEVLMKKTSLNKGFTGKIPYIPL